MNQFKTIQQSMLIMFFLTLSIMLITTVQASEFHVTTTQELQTALSTAAENNQSDSIFLAAGIYKGNFRFNTEESDTSLSIQAEEGLNAGNVILDGEERDRVLSIDSGDNKLNVLIKHLTLKNGKNSSYSGLYIKSKGNVSISSCYLTDNTGYGIGACYVYQANHVLISNSRIENNAATQFSGIKIESSDDITLEGNEFINNENNTNNSGFGCVSIAGTTITIRRNIFSQNSKNGKTLIISGSGTLVSITKNKFTQNEQSSVSIGGSHNIDFSNNIIENCKGGGSINSTESIQFHSNIFIKNSSSMNLSSNLIEAANNIIAKNIHRGLSVISSGTICFNNNTIIQNTTTYDNGGGLYININNTTAILNLYNNIIWGNTAKNGGGDIYLNGYGSKKNFYNNNVQEIVGTFDFAANNIDVAPLFVNTEKDDYHLGAGSLCINAGTNDAPEIPGLDFDGNPRIGDNTVDIGVYEHSSTDYHPADTNKDWNLTATEVTAYETAWKNGSSWSEGPSQIPMNYLTRAGFLQQSGGTYKNAGGAKPLCWVTVD